MNLTDFNKKDNSKKKSNDNNKDTINNTRNFEINFKEIKSDLKEKEKDYFLPWFLKHRVLKFEDLKLTDDIKKILKFIEEKKYDKSILLYGRPGSGKTTTLNLIGEHFNYEVVEMNASDTRNKSSINDFLKNVISQKSLFSKNQKKLIIIDEVDGISGNYDRGGVLEIIKLMKKTKFPIVFCANEIENPKIKAIKKECICINFENSSKDILFNLGKKIFESEKIRYEDKDLKKFIEEIEPFDIRGFINDIQANSIDKKFIYEKDNENFSTRDYKKIIDKILFSIYYEEPKKAYENFRYQNISQDDLLLFLEENTPKIFNKKENFLSFEQICKADLFKSKIFKWQYYRYMVYIGFYLTFAVSSQKNKPKFTKVFVRNQRILKKWIYNNKIGFLNPRTKIQKENNEEEKLIEKLAKKYKQSVKKFKQKTFRFFLFNYKNDKLFRDEINNEFKIDKIIENKILNI